MTALWTPRLTRLFHAVLMRQEAGQAETNALAAEYEALARTMEPVLRETAQKHLMPILEFWRRQGCTYKTTSYPGGMRTQHQDDGKNGPDADKPYYQPPILAFTVYKPGLGVFSKRMMHIQIHERDVIPGSPIVAAISAKDIRYAKRFYMREKSEAFQEHILEAAMAMMPRLRGAMQNAIPAVVRGGQRRSIV